MYFWRNCDESCIACRLHIFVCFTACPQMSLLSLSVISVLCMLHFLSTTDFSSFCALYASLLAYTWLFLFFLSVRDDLQSDSWDHVHQQWRRGFGRQWRDGMVKTFHWHRRFLQVYKACQRRTSASLGLAYGRRILWFSHYCIEVGLVMVPCSFCAKVKLESKRHSLLVGVSKV